MSEKKREISHHTRGENWLFTVWPNGRVEISAGQRKDDRVIALDPDDVREIFGSPNSETEGADDE